MAVQRRNMFGLGYGSDKIERSRPHPLKVPPMTSAPVPLPITAQAQLPNEQQQPQGPEQQQPAQYESVLQELISRFGGQHG